MATTQAFTIPQELLRIHAFWQLLQRHLSGLNTQQDSTAKKLGAILLHLSLDHLAAMVTLVETSQFSSALTLMRPQYEAAVRGAWFSFVATERDARYFLEDQRRPNERDSVPKIRVMIDQLTDARSEMQGLADVHTGSWSYLNDYTHGGSIVAKSRFQAGIIECSITEQHAAACVAQARRLGVIAAVWLSDVMGRPDLANVFYEHLCEHDKCAATTRP